MRRKIEPDSRREEFLHNKRVYVLKKSRSPFRLEYIESSEDPWFIYAVKIRKSTGKFESCEMIILKDLDNWISCDLGRGWEIESSNITS